MDNASAQDFFEKEIEYNGMHFDVLNYVNENRTFSEYVFFDSLDSEHVLSMNLIRHLDSKLGLSICASVVRPTNSFESLDVENRLVSQGIKEVYAMLEYYAVEADAAARNFNVVANSLGAGMVLHSLRDERLDKNIKDYSFSINDKLNSVILISCVPELPENLKKQSFTGNTFDYPVAANKTITLPNSFVKDGSKYSAQGDNSSYSGRLLFIHGSEDSVYAVNKFDSFLFNFTQSTNKIETILGADHGFTNYKGQLFQEVLSALKPENNYWNGNKNIK